MKTTGLTVKEAIESGKPFKRLHQTNWYGPLDLESNGDRGIPWTTENILYNDWQLKIEPREWDVWVHHENPNVITMQSPRNAELVNSDEWSKIRVREIL